MAARALPIPLGAPPGSVNAFGGPLPNDANRPHQHNAQNASNQMFGAIGGPSSGPSGSAGGAGPVFGGPLQQESARPGQSIPFGSSGGGGGGAGAVMAASNTLIPGGSAGNNSGALQQGQQPILNVSCALCT